LATSAETRREARLAFSAERDDDLDSLPDAEGTSSVFSLRDVVGSTTLGLAGSWETW
jgi:hypothetical protein